MTGIKKKLIIFWGALIITALTVFIVVAVILSGSRDADTSYGSAPANILNGGTYCYTENALYYSDGVMLYMLADGKQTELSPTSAENINIIKDTLYFYNKKGIVRMKVGSEPELISEITPSHLYIFGEKIYALDADTKSIYEINDKGDVRINTDCKIKSFIPASGGFYIIEETTGRLCFVTEKGKMTVAPDVTAFKISRHDGVLYYIDKQTYRLYSYDFDKKSGTLISDMMFNCINFIGSKAYAGVFEGEKNSIVSFDIESGNPVTHGEHLANRIVSDGKSAYFYDDCCHNKLVKIE